MAHYTGDELTYKILVDAERKQNIQPIVIRSAIAPDTGENKRLREKRIYPIGSHSDSIQKIGDISQLWKGYTLQQQIEGDTLSDTSGESIYEHQNEADHFGEEDKNNVQKGVIRETERENEDLSHTYPTIVSKKSQDTK